MPKIDAVIVTYNPDLEKLKHCILSIYSQVRKVWLVDNATKGFEVDILGLAADVDLECINLETNTGIAFAQNIGIKRVLENGAEYILLSDQDSFYPDNYIGDMYSIFMKIQGEIAAVAPLFHDVLGENKNEGFVINSKKGFRKIYPESGQYEVFQTIASGLLINSKYISSIGLMDEELFIDWVDIEWCWRAVNKGYKIIGNADIQIEHNLGDDIVRLVDRNITVRSPIRHYYITRNAFHLALRDQSLNFSQKLILFYKGTRYIVGFSVFVSPRMRNLRMTVLGLYHGLKGQLGKLR